MRAPASILLALLVASCSSKERAVQVEDGEPAIVYPEAGPPPTPGHTKLDAETHLAVAPDGSVMVAWIGYAVNQPTIIGYEVSRDGARTFEPRQGTFSPGQRDSSDPVITATPSGDFFVTWIGFRRSGGSSVSDGHVYVAKLPAGGTQLEPAVEASTPGQAPFFDKPWIATARDGRLVVSYAWFRNEATGIAVATSFDGQSWEHADIAEDPAFAGNLAYVCAAPDSDRVWATWWEPPGRIRARWSDDGGRSWPSEASLIVSEAGESVGFADPGCVASGTEAWFVYGISRDEYAATTMPDLTTLPVVHVRDGQIVARGHAEDPASGAHYLLPQIVREDGGAIDVSYYTGTGEGDVAGKIVFTRSAGPGLAFGAATSIHEGVVFSHARDQPVWLGDYTGLAWRAGTLFASYVDNARGISGIDVWHGSVP